LTGKAVINTIEISRKLQASGLTQKQAEAIAESMLQIPDWGNLATKTDLDALKLATKADLATLKSDLIMWFVGAFFLNAVAQIIAGFLHH
jgi:hypothetical protein